MNLNIGFKKSLARTVAITALFAAFAAGARAQCGSAAPRMAAAARLKAGLAVMDALSQSDVPLQAQSREEESSDAPITGLWKAVFVSGGVTVDIGFDQWHSDGTEIMNDTPPPAAGNVCLGTWDKVGPRTYSLIHPTFNFDAAGTTVVSIFIERLQVTLSQDGASYAGTFTWDSHDFKGNLLPASHVAGTVTAKRIKVGGVFPFPF